MVFVNVMNCLMAFVALSSGALNKPAQSQIVVLGSMSIGGTINKVEEFPNVLQVCFVIGEKNIASNVICSRYCNVTCGDIC